MTDEPSRDLDSAPDNEPDTVGGANPTDRGRFGGLTGRFRRRPTEPSPSRDPVPDENAPTAEASTEGATEWTVPTPAARPSADADETDATSTDDEAERDSSDDPPEPLTPHPELHPALRRDTLDSTSAEVATPPSQPVTEHDDVAVADASTEPTSSPRSPVIEERIAVTPRPVQPPAPPTAPPVAANDTPVDDAAAPSQSSPTDEDEEQGVVPNLSRRLTGISAHLTVLTGIAMTVVLAFILIEPTPRWFLILGAGAVILGLDGTLRETWREPFAFGQETAPFLFVPALFMLSVPVLIEHNFQGEVVILAGIGAGLAFGSLAWAELASVRSFGIEYPQARILVTANTYLVGFAIFSLTYVYSIPLPAAIAACGIAAGMLAVEVLREGEIDPAETLGLSLVAAVVIAEARWLFYYAPLDTYLAGLTLLLVFYLLTGLLHSHVVRALSAPLAVQYGGITAAGLALVIIARAAGLA